MLFEIDISEKDLAASVFMGRNHRKLINAAIDAKRKHGITQRQIAQKLGVGKSVISRILSGKGNLTERTLGELCWALGVEPELLLTEINDGNHKRSKAWQPHEEPVKKVTPLNVGYTSTSYSEPVKSTYKMTENA